MIKRPEVVASDEIAKILDAMVEHLDALLDEFFVFTSSTEWKPESSKAPWMMERSAAKRQLGPTERWTDDTVAHAMNIVSLHLSLSSQLLEGLKALIAARQIIHPLGPIVRSLEENCGFVCWLIFPRRMTVGPSLGEDGSRLRDGWTVRDRAARVQLAVVEDLRRQKSMALTLGRPDAPKIGARYRHMRRGQTDALFYPSELDRTKGQLRIRDEVFPKLSQLPAWMSHLHEKGWNSGGIYSILSNATHPSTSYLTEFVKFVHDGAPGRWQIDDAVFVYWQIKMAIFSFVTAWSLTAAYLGHTQWEPLRFARALEQDPRLRESESKLQAASKGS